MIPGFHWKAPGKNPLKYLTDALATAENLQLVHNTFTRLADVKSVQERKLFFCICAQANLYIEKTLPDIPMLASSISSLTIGTDSYASNHSLSVMDEIKTISKYYPAITLNELLKWATLNGAGFLHVQNKFGSLEKGKQPGILSLDIERGTVKRII
jgi:cytosine/adenosine deaminase-related metal-dependent hydrolase